jgi:AraC-like DNA-binding protein
VLLPRPSESAAFGAARPWPSLLVTWGDGAVSGLHAHHAWQLMVALDASLSVRAAESDVLRQGVAVLVHPDTTHAIDASGGRVVLAFVEPESAIGQGLLAARTGDKVELLAPKVARKVHDVLSKIPGALREVEGACEEALELLGARDVKPKLRHPGIRRVLGRLRESQLLEDPSLATLAKLAGLSESRFMHAFTEDVGIPLRPYVRWLKLERAATAIASGAELSEVAHAAGFADVAHMTRSFREMYGVTPSDLRRRSQSAQEPDAG